MAALQVAPLAWHPRLARWRDTCRGRMAVPARKQMVGLSLKEAALS